MSKKEAIIELKALQQESDYEMAHALADRTLCDLLEEMGMGEVVEEYLKITRFCA